MKKFGLANTGFTLVELIVVITILGIISAILVPNYIHYVDKANSSVCESNLSEFEHAYELKRLSTISTVYSQLLQDSIEEQGGTITAAPSTVDGKITVEFTGPCPSGGTCKIVISSSDGEIDTASCDKHAY